MTKQFLKYALPSALALFVSSLYTVIDGIFLGQGVGDSALAAVSIVLPFIVVIFGIANMLAVGGGALVSKNLGAQNINQAVNIFRQVCKLLLILSLVITLISTLFTEQIVSLLGATDQLKPLSIEYLRYYGIFCIPNLIGIVLNSFVRNDGRPKLAMVSTIIGALTNIILDYLFIFPLNMGIQGAAIASGLGQIVTVAILLPHFIKKVGHLSFKNVALDKNTIKDISSLGFPSFFGQASFSIIVLLHNIALAKLIGEIGLSTYSIINYVTNNIYMILLGLTFGAQPLISFNFGQKSKEKMLAIYKINNISSLTVSVGAFIICFIFGKQIVSIFTTDPEIIKLGSTALFLTALAHVIVGLNLNTVVYFQAIEIPKYSNLICLFRSVLFLPLCLIILPKLLGLTGIWISVLASELLTYMVMKIIADLETNTNKSLLLTHSK